MLLNYFIIFWIFSQFFLGHLKDLSKIIEFWTAFLTNKLSHLKKYLIISVFL